MCQKIMEGVIRMEMKCDGVSVDILPDCAFCRLDEKKRSPLDMDECPIGCEECDGDCPYYEEDWG